MHLIIAFASVLSAAGRQALQTLALPNLASLVSRLAAQEPDAGDEYSLTPPHEREHARALGLEQRMHRLEQRARFVFCQLELCRID